MFAWNSFLKKGSFSAYEWHHSVRLFRINESFTLQIVVEARLVSSCLSWPSRAKPRLSLLSLSRGVIWKTRHIVELGGTCVSCSIEATWHLYWAELYRLWWNQTLFVFITVVKLTEPEFETFQMSANCRTDIFIFFTALLLLFVI